jgi:hypothetical protein
MAVGVVRPDRDQRDPGAGRDEEVGIGVRAPVMGHLEHVGPEIGPRGQDAGLGSRAQVSREQHPDPSIGDPDEEGEVVRLREGGRPLRRRREDLEVGSADGPMVAGDQHVAVGPGTSDEPVERGLPVVGGRQGARRHDADAPPLECSRQPSGVVGIEMGQDDQGQLVDPEPVEATVHGPDVGPGVDEHPLPRPGGQNEGVTLTDVTGDDHRVRWRPAAHDLPDGPAQHEKAEQRGQGKRSKAGKPPQQTSGAQEQHREQDGAGCSGRPAGGCVRQRGGTVGDQHEPPHGPAGDPHECVAERRADQPHYGGGEPQHGRRRHRRGGQEVRRQRHQTDRPGETGDQRRGRDAGGGAHREGIGHQRRPTASPQPSGPARGEQHDRARGHGGECEARVPRQAGVDQQQHAHRSAQRRERCAGAAGGERDQRDAAHGCCAQHAGARPCQHHETDQRQGRHQRLDATIDRPPSQWPDHAGQHDGHVGSGHGQEMRQPRPPEVLDENRIHSPRVARDEAGQQSRRACVQHPGRRGAEPVPHDARGALHGARRADGDRRPPRGQDGDRLVPRSRHRGACPDTHGLPRHDVAPALGRGEEQDGRGEPIPGATVVQGGHRRVRHHLRRPDPGQYVRIVVQLHGHPDRATGLGSRAQGR